MTPAYTATMQAKAAMLVERAPRYTTERGCNCPSYTHRLACSHVLAVKTEAEAARETVGYRPAADSDSSDLVDAF